MEPKVDVTAIDEPPGPSVYAISTRSGSLSTTCATIDRPDSPGTTASLSSPTDFRRRHVVVASWTGRPATGGAGTRFPREAGGEGTDFATLRSRPRAGFASQRRRSRTPSGTSGAAFERIRGNEDEVGARAGRDDAEVAAPAEELGRVRGRGAKDLRARHPGGDHELELVWSASPGTTNGLPCPCRRRSARRPSRARRGSARARRSPCESRRSVGASSS